MTVSFETTKVKPKAIRFLVLLMCLSVTSVTYALELGYLLPAVDAAAQQVPESAMLVLLGLTLLFAAHHARRRAGAV